jgi:hypothetical protein
MAWALPINAKINSAKWPCAYAGWPDRANWALLLTLGRFLKYKTANFWGANFFNSTSYICINFDKKWDGLRFWAIFYKLIWSPCTYVSHNPYITRDEGLHFLWCLIGGPYIYIGHIGWVIIWLIFSLRRKIQHGVFFLWQTPTVKVQYACQRIYQKQNTLFSIFDNSMLTD